jgi:hypothetical protein
MAHRRRPPADFDARINEISKLIASIEEQRALLDEAFISLVIKDKAPTTTVAERLGMIPQAVTYRCAAALKRRRPKS